MNVHIFGAVSSPATCSHALRQTAADSGEDARTVTRHVKDHFYVDNWLVSFATEEEAIEHARIVTTALRRGGFELAQWGSSSLKVMHDLPGEPVKTLKLDVENTPVERTLGLALNYKEDTFVIKTKASDNGSTKRELLRATASIFDPLGFLAPLLPTAKLIMQDVCRKDFDWNDKFPEEILKRWEEWAESLSSLCSLSVPRCMIHDDVGHRLQLHTFSDASERGLGAVVYLRNPNIPPDVFKEGDMELKKRWRFAQTIADHFWRR